MVETREDLPVSFFTQPEYNHQLRRLSAEEQPDKRAERERLREDVEAFLRQGGRIQPLPPEPGPQR